MRRYGFHGLSYEYIASVLPDYLGPGAAMGRIVVAHLGSGASMAADGTRHGYDIEQLTRVRALCDVPLVASGGAGTPRHFERAFREAHVDAALAASVFHSGQIVIAELKRELRRSGLEVRL